MDIHNWDYRYPEGLLFAFGYPYKFPVWKKSSVIYSVLFKPTKNRPSLGPHLPNSNHGISWNFNIVLYSHVYVDVLSNLTNFETFPMVFS